MPSHIHRLFEHLWWADDLCGRSLATLDSEDSELVGLYAHVIGAELIWLDRIEGVPASVDVWPATDLADSRSLADTSQERYRDFLQGLDHGRLHENVVYMNSRGDQFESTVEDILIHVAMHGSYHRGQIARGVREHAGTPAPTDYIGFIRGVPAATRNDSGHRNEFRDPSHYRSQETPSKDSGSESSDERPDIPLL